MKKIITSLALMLTAVSFAQVGIGTTTPDESSILDIDVTSLAANAKKGLLTPRMTAAERTAIATPANGLMVFQTDGNKGFWYYDATATVPAWVKVADGAAASKWTNDDANNRVFLTNEADGTTPRTQAKSVVVTDAGNVGVGQLTPTAKLHVTNNALTATSKNLIVFGGIPTSEASSSYFVGIEGGVKTNVADTTNKLGLFGMAANAEHDGTGTVSDFRAASFRANNNSSGIVESAEGVVSIVDNKGSGIMSDAKTISSVLSNAGGGTITNGRVFSAAISTTNDGITNAAGLYVFYPSGAATNSTGVDIFNLKGVSTAYGIRLRNAIEAPAGSAWGIFSETTAPSYFAGNVGIGTNAPTTPLHVLGSATLGNTAGTSPGELFLNPTNATDEGGQINIKRSVAGSTADWTIDQTAAGTFGPRFRIFGGSNENTGINILENGKVGVGRNPAFNLDVSGPIGTVGGSFPTIGDRSAIGYNSLRPGFGEFEMVNYRGTGGGGFRFYAIPNVGLPVLGTHDISYINLAGQYLAFSDKRIKSNIKNITYGLQEVMALRPVSYNRHIDYRFENGVVTPLDKGMPTIGFIAQEVYEVLPDVAVKPENEATEKWSINMDNFIPVMVKATQEQQAQIEALKDEVKKLTALVQQLSKK